MKPTTFKEAEFGFGGGLDVVSSVVGAGDGGGFSGSGGASEVVAGGTSAGLGGGGEGGADGKVAAAGGGDGCIAGATFVLRLLLSAITTTTIDSFLRQLFSFPLMK